MNIIKLILFLSCFSLYISPSSRRQNGSGEGEYFINMGDELNQMEDQPLTIINKTTSEQTQKKIIAFQALDTDEKLNRIGTRQILQLAKKEDKKCVKHCFNIVRTGLGIATTAASIANLVLYLNNQKTT